MGDACNCSCKCDASNGVGGINVLGSTLGVVKPRWKEFSCVYLMWPTVMQFVMTLFFLILSHLYSNAYHHKRFFYKFIHTFVGTVERPQVNYPIFIVLFELVQLVCSSIAVHTFVTRTYTHSTATMDRIEQIISCFFIFHYFVRAIMSGFSPFGIWHLIGFVDMLTVVPVFFRRMYDLSQAPEESLWLSLGFLRSLFLLRAYQQVEATLDLVAEIPRVHRAAFRTFLRTFALVCCMGGAILIFEILGEIPGFEDDHITTEMGDLSFYQMLYWIFTTISTVGYGDFAPTTLPSRMCIVVFIIVGVLFFNLEYVTLHAMVTSATNGEGRYIPFVDGDQHVVVVSNSLGAGMSSRFMDDFLRELLDSELLDTAHSSRVPNVVLLSEKPYDRNLMDFARTCLAPRVRKRVFFLVGTAVSEKDLSRVRLEECQLALVLLGLASPDCETEDSQNIVRAIEMTRYVAQKRRELRLRLVLWEPESFMRAVNVGLDPEACIDIKGLKARLFAHSCRVKGFIPMLIGMLQKTLNFDFEELKALIDEADHVWMKEYVGGLQGTLVAFVLDPKFGGKPFSKAVEEIYDQSNGDVLLVAAQHEGIFKLNFTGKLAPLGGSTSDKQVVVAISRHDKGHNRFTDNAQPDWRCIYSEEQKAFRPQLLKTFSSYDVEELSLGVTGENFTSTKSVPDAHKIRKNIEQFQERDNLITLVVLGDLKQDSSWWQVIAFLKALRDPVLSFHEGSDSPSHRNYQPVIVLTPETPPNDVLARFFNDEQDIVFLSGSQLKVKNLEDAGVKQAQTVVVMREPSNTADLTPGPDALLTDHDVVMLVSTIEQMIADCHKDHFTVFEFATVRSMDMMEHALTHVRSQVPIIKNLPKSSKSRFEINRFFNYDDEGISWVWRVSRTFFRVIATLVTEGFVYPETDIADILGTRSLLHRRFAAGQAFIPDIFGVVLGRMFTFPHVIPMLQVFTMFTPTSAMDDCTVNREQTSFVWQVRCPKEWVNREYGDLLGSWVRGDDEELKKNKCGCVIAIALFRQYHDDVKSAWCKGSEGFNMTLPQGHEQLQETDMITVLGNEKFGQVMAERRLLRGAGSPHGYVADGLQVDGEHLRDAGDAAKTLSEQKTLYVN